jgi:hypothetical protein
MIQSRMMGVGVIAVLLASSPTRTAHSANKGDASVATADTISLDSCVSLDRLARTPKGMPELGDKVPPPNPGTWTDVKRVALDSFSIEIPRVASVRHRDAHGSYLITDLPTCRYSCAIEVSLSHDFIGKTVDDYVARLPVADDTGNPATADGIVGTPKAVTVDGNKGLMIQTDCGDCIAGEIVAIRNRTVAHLAYNLDDRNGYQPGLVCRVVRAASTFHWNRPKT